MPLFRGSPQTGSGKWSATLGRCFWIRSYWCYQPNRTRYLAQCTYPITDYRVDQVKTRPPVTNRLEERTDRALHLIFKVPTDKEYVRHTVRGIRIVCCPGRAQYHPFSDGPALSTLEHQIPTTVVYKPHTAAQRNSGGQAQGSIASVADDKIPAPPRSKNSRPMRFCLFGEDVFYIPVSEIQEAVDAFLLLNGILYILQFTVSLKHSIKPGFVDFLQKCQHVPPLEEWKFVFLIPPRITLVCPEPKSELCNLNPYSAEIDLRPYLTRLTNSAVHHS